MRLGEATTPDGLRLYAIGDIHGCIGMLAEMHDKIAADLAARPPADHRIIHIGDYGDRGPDSAGVVARLAALTATDPRVLALRGNHDQMLIDFLADPDASAPMLLGNGGKETLRSYGVKTRGQNYASLAAQLAEKLPAADRAFLTGLRLTARFGDYLFVHAGIRPGVPLAAQAAADLIWIREPFLFDPRDHGVVVVHGHTPANPAEVMPNRINVDTGAVYGGPMTCAVLEGTDTRFLEVAPGVR